MTVRGAAAASRNVATHHVLLCLCCLALGVSGFQPRIRTRADAHAYLRPQNMLRSAPVSMKKWTARKTLAEVEGGANDKGAAAVGLTGTIPVEFTQGNETKTTMAMVGQPLMDVASQAGQYIKYKCRKGECGTCEVRIDGQWVRTCTHKIPYIEPNSKLAVHVRPSMVPKGKKSSRFFSFRSFISGAKNNILGMVGFVREGRKSKNQFDERMQLEKDLLAKAAAKRAERLANADKK